MRCFTPNLKLSVRKYLSYILALILKKNQSHKLKLNNELQVQPYVSLFQTVKSNSSINCQSHVVVTKILNPLHGLLSQPDMHQIIS